MWTWQETAGLDRRMLTAKDIAIRSLMILESAAAVVMRDIYFEGAEVLRCSYGHFRFTFDGTNVIELGPGETLVIYPGYRVSIEALEPLNRLVYGIFTGSSIENYLDSLGFFHGEHGKTASYEELFRELQKLVDELGKGKVDRNQLCLSCLTDILLSMAKDLHENGNGRIGDYIRQIRKNLNNGIVRLEPLCAQLHVSRAHLHAVFVSAGIGSPSAFIRREQVRMILRLLRTTSMSIADVARKAGFISMTHFSNFMRQNTGKSARDWRQGR